MDATRLELLRVYLHAGEHIPEDYVEELLAERDDAVSALAERESALARIDALAAQTEELRAGLQALRDEYTLALERRVRAMRGEP